MCAPIAIEINRTYVRCSTGWLIGGMAGSTGWLARRPLIAQCGDPQVLDSPEHLLNSEFRYLPAPPAANSLWKTKGAFERGRPLAPRGNGSDRPCSQRGGASPATHGGPCSVAGRAHKWVGPWPCGQEPPVRTGRAGPHPAHPRLALRRARGGLGGRGVRGGRARGRCRRTGSAIDDYQRLLWT